MHERLLPLFLAAVEGGATVDSGGSLSRLTSRPSPNPCPMPLFKFAPMGFRPKDGIDGGRFVPWSCPEMIE